MELRESENPNPPPPFSSFRLESELRESESSNPSPPLSFFRLAGNGLRRSENSNTPPPPRVAGAGVAELHRQAASGDQARGRAQEPVLPVGHRRLLEEQRQRLRR